MSDSYLRSARQQSGDRLEKLKSDLQGAEQLVAGRACVYATGSFGRREAGAKSDLDLFIVLKTHFEEKDSKNTEVSSLNGLDEIKLKYRLMEAVENNRIPEFDGNGKYLQTHTITDFTRNLGSQEDDSKNTLTGRLLMLLESKPLLGEDIYHEALDKVISAYFVDYAGNEENFVPAFLINDMLRMWSTFCVNYEHKRKGGTIKSKTKNIKLKYSRMLTCYSAIIFLVAVFSQNGSVTPDDVRRMVAVTPTERLGAISRPDFWAAGLVSSSLEESISEALKLYSEFLELVHKDEADIAAEFEGRQEEWRGRSHQFGEKLAEILDILKDSSPAGAHLYRIVLI